MNADSMPNYVRLSVVKNGRAVNHAAAFEGFRINGESIAKTAIKKLEKAVERDGKYFDIKAHASWAINPENDEGVPMVCRLFNALAEVVPASQIGPWLGTPNPAFEASTPIQVIERGESDRIWRMIWELRGGNSGD
jgi:hypothetical protein